MDRKKFMITSSLAAFSAATFGRIGKTDSGSFVGDCETTNDILGPFYRPNAPQRYNMTYDGLIGTAIELKGRVFLDDCTTPIEKCLVEIWHCNTEGEYDNTSKKFNQRSSWITNKDGSYAFKTIMPGKYLNGRLYRPAHIHFRVTAEGHKELISQIYFQGDPHILTDPWASQKKAVLRTLPIIPENTSGILAVNFDIYLDTDK